MVAHILRLRLDLLVGALRGELRHTLRTVIGFALIVAVVCAGTFGLIVLQGASETIANTVVVVGGSAVTAGYIVAALVGGFEDQLDPRRFAVFGMSPGRAAGSLLVGSVISVPLLALCVLAAGFAVLWQTQGVSWGISILSAFLVLITSLLATKLALGVGALVLRGRRSRELSGLFLVAVLVVAVPVAVYFFSVHNAGEPSPTVSGAVSVLSLTPLGAAWAIPGAALNGDLAGPLLISMLTVTALGGLWVWLVRVLLTTTERPGGNRERQGLGWFALLPGTPAGGIAARSLVYWLRDPRYLVNIVVIPLAAVVSIVPLLLVDVPVEYVALVPAPLMALFFGWLAHNDLAYDSTALWMHVASAVRGVSDRVGRLVPVLLVGVPVLAVAIIVSASFCADASVLLVLIGVCASLFLCGLGLSSLSSVIAPYAATRPGDGPFQQPQRTNGGLAQSVVLLGAIVLSLPALWWAWVAVSGEPGEAWTTLWAGVGGGIAVFALGVFGGGAIFDRSGGRLMEFAEST